MTGTEPERAQGPGEPESASVWERVGAALKLRPAEITGLTVMSALVGFLSGLAQFVGPFAHSGSALIAVTLVVAVGGTVAVAVVVVAINRLRSMSRPLRAPLWLALSVLIMVGAGGGLIGHFVGQPAGAGRSSAVGPGPSGTPLATGPMSAGPGTSTPGSSTSPSMGASSGSSISGIPGGLSVTSEGVLHFSVTGSCTTASGTLQESSSGFTPGGAFTVSAWTPAGAPYNLGSNTSGTVAADGSVPWSWLCTGDPAGRYTTQLIDMATGRSTGRVGFTVGAAPATQAPSSTVPETTGSVAQTWTDHSNAGGTQGANIPSNTTVQIACKVTGFQVSDGDTWWYRISSDPWDGQFYVSADGFYNNGQTSGSLNGTPAVDNNVPTC